MRVSQALLDETFPPLKDSEGNVISPYTGTGEGIVWSGREIFSVDFRMADISGIMFEDCVLANVDFTDCDLSNATFSNCDISDVVFSHALMYDVRFFNCRIRDCWFLYTLFKEAFFERSSILGCTFSNSTWSSMTFSECEFYLNGLIDLSLGKVEGLDIRSKKGANVGTVIFDATNDRVYHRTIAGKYSDVIRRLRLGSKHQRTDDCIELLRIVHSFKETS